MKHEFERKVAFSPEDVLARIDRAIDHERLAPLAVSGYVGAKQVIGRVSGQSFSLQRRRAGKNGFAPHLFGRVEPVEGGALVRARFAMDVTTRWGLAAYLGFTLVLPLAIAIAQQSPDSLVLLGAGVVLALIGLTIAGIGVVSGAHEKVGLLAFLDQQLRDAPPVDS